MVKCVGIMRMHHNKNILKKALMNLRKYNIVQFETCRHSKSVWACIISLTFLVECYSIAIEFHGILLYLCHKHYGRSLVILTIIFWIQGLVIVAQNLKRSLCCKNKEQTLWSFLNDITLLSFYMSVSHTSHFSYIIVDTTTENTVNGLTLSRVCACPNPRSEFPTSYVMVFFMFNYFKVRCDCSFCWYWWNCWPSLF